MGQCTADLAMLPGAPAPALALASLPGAFPPLSRPLAVVLAPLSAGTRLILLQEHAAMRPRKDLLLHSLSASPSRLDWGSRDRARWVHHRIPGVQSTGCQVPGAGMTSHVTIPLDAKPRASTSASLRLQQLNCGQFAEFGGTMSGPLTAKVDSILKKRDRCPGAMWKNVGIQHVVKWTLLSLGILSSFSVCHQSRYPWTQQRFLLALTTTTRSIPRAHSTSLKPRLNQITRELPRSSHCGCGLEYTCKNEKTQVRRW